MNPRKFALIGGIVMLVMGVLSFVPGFSAYSLELPVLNVETSYGIFLGLFTMNVFNKVALLALGAWGVWAATRPGTSLPASITYSRTVAMICGAFAILGLIPATNTLFGYWPLYGANVLSSAVFAIVGAYFGYALTTTAHNEHHTPARRVETTLREV